jgi:hypothetical protein
MQKTRGYMSMNAMRWYLLICVTAILAQPGWAQSWNAYLVGGGAHNDGTLHSHTALGGEIIIRERFGLGAEIGAVMGHNSFAETSFNGSYHFSNGKVDPFITGGYTACSLLSTINYGNAGGGLNYWFSQHVGVRAEFRAFFNGTLQFPIFRGGIAFR